MDFIKKLDWSDRYNPKEEFINESDIDNSCALKIINAEFRDPLLSSDSEDDKDNIKKMQIIKILDKINKKKTKAENTDNVKIQQYIPGLKAPPPYPKLSILTEQEHKHCLRVLMSNDCNIVSFGETSKPAKIDFNIFQKCEQKYIKEQKEFLDFAKDSWIKGVCVRALKPSPIAERIYEADYNTNCYVNDKLPQDYEMAAQIPVVTLNADYEFTHVEDITPKKSLQPIQIPSCNNKFTILSNKVTLPKLCAQHPIPITLPGENSTTSLDLNMIHERLSELAFAKHCECVINSSALISFCRLDRTWNIPITVLEVNKNARKRVAVIDGPIKICKEFVRTRTERAYELLLRYALVKYYCNIAHTEVHINGQDEHTANINGMTNIVDSDSESENLVIDEYFQREYVTEMEEKTDKLEEIKKSIVTQIEPRVTRSKSATVTSSKSNTSIHVEMSDKGNIKKTEENIYPASMESNVDCSCKESHYGKTFIRSYRKWCLKGTTDNNCEPISMIIHTSNKHQQVEGKEVVLNPIVEYQPEYGGASLNMTDIMSKALDLHIREDSILLTARIDALTGDVIKFEWSSKGQLEAANQGVLIKNSINSLYSVLSHIVRLLPGKYILRHEPNHGSNAMLFVARDNSKMTPNCHKLSLNQTIPDFSEQEAKSVQMFPPHLCNVLLPIHKYRNILPLAFTYNSKLVKNIKEISKKEPAVKQRRKKKKIKKKKL